MPEVHDSRVTRELSHVTRSVPPLPSPPAVRIPFPGQPPTRRSSRRQRRIETAAVPGALAASCTTAFAAPCGSTPRPPPGPINYPPYISPRAHRYGPTYHLNSRTYEREGREHRPPPTYIPAADGAARAIELPARRYARASPARGLARVRNGVVPKVRARGSPTALRVRPIRCDCTACHFLFGRSCAFASERRSSNGNARTSLARSPPLRAPSSYAARLKSQTERELSVSSLAAENILFPVHFLVASIVPHRLRLEFVVSRAQVLARTRDGKTSPRYSLSTATLNTRAAAHPLNGIPVERRAAPSRAL